MNTKALLQTAEVGMIAGSTVYSLSNIYSILGIIILALDLVLIGFKIYQAVKTSLAKGTDTDIEDTINEAKELLEKVQSKLPKGDSNGDNTSTE